MPQIIFSLIILLLTGCSTYSVTCLHNEATSSDLLPDEDTHVHNRDGKSPSQVIIKTNKEKKNYY